MVLSLQDREEIRIAKFQRPLSLSSSPQRSSASGRQQSSKKGKLLRGQELKEHNDEEEGYLMTERMMTVNEQQQNTFMMNDAGSPANFPHNNDHDDDDDDDLSNHGAFAANNNYEQNLQDQFERAVRILQDLPKDSSLQPTNDEKLQFYGAFKQATVGPCDVPKPAFWDIVAKAKWDAWIRVKHLQKTEAMELYIETLLQFLKRFPDRPQALEIITSFDSFIRKEVLSGYFTAIESSSPDNRPIGVSSVQDRGMIGTEFLPPQSQLANQQPKFQDTGRGSVDATSVVRPLYSNVNGIPIMSRISSDPQVEFGAFQKMQESIHNFEYRMDKLENRINALTENIKQIVMDQRRTQKYPTVAKWTGLALLTALFIFFVSRRSQPMKVVGSLILSRIFTLLKV